MNLRCFRLFFFLGCFNNNKKYKEYNLETFVLYNFYEEQVEKTVFHIWVRITFKKYFQKLFFFLFSKNIAKQTLKISHTSKNVELTNAVFTSRV